MGTEQLLTVLRDPRYVGQGGMREQAAETIERLQKLVDDLAPFLAVWAARYEKDHGLNGFHPVHYDLLAQTNIRMNDFKRATDAPAI